MEDITLRAIRTMKEVDLIAAEDTRQTRKLLGRYEVSTPLVSYHDHNKENRTSALLEKLKTGASIALVTDAGTPSISDPGYYLVREAIRKAVPVVPIPGVSAMVAALSVSGLPTDSFVFIGFVPKKTAKRKRLLDQLATEPRTLVFYESPKRLLGLIRELLNIMGDREAVMARELTKVHEEVRRSPLSTMVKKISGRPTLKGECVLLLAGCKRERKVDRRTLQRAIRHLCQNRDWPLSEVVRKVAREYDIAKKTVYDEALKIAREEQASDKHSPVRPCGDHQKE